MWRYIAIVLASLILNQTQVPSAEARSKQLANIELALLMDCSYSMYMTSQHWLKQRDGHVWAIMDPQISDALLRNDVVVRVVYWAAGKGHGINDEKSVFERFQSIHIRSKKDVVKLVQNIREHTPTKHCMYSNTWQYLGVQYVLERPRLGKQLIIDITTDERVGGPSRSMAVRDLAYETGATINALVIGTKEIKDDIKRSVTTPNGFALQVTGWKSYAAGIRAKLIKELADAGQGVR